MGRLFDRGVARKGLGPKHYFSDFIILLCTI